MHFRVLRHDLDRCEHVSAFDCFCSCLLVIACFCVVLACFHWRLPLFSRVFPSFCLYVRLIWVAVVFVLLGLVCFWLYLFSVFFLYVCFFVCLYVPFVFALFRFSLSMLLPAFAVTERCIWELFEKNCSFGFRVFSCLLQKIFRIGASISEPLIQKSFRFSANASVFLVNLIRFLACHFR